MDADGPPPRRPRKDRLRKHLPVPDPVSLHGQGFCGLLAKTERPLLRLVRPASPGVPDWEVSLCGRWRNGTCDPVLRPAKASLCQAACGLSGIESGRTIFQGSAQRA